jgi:hypothetical protein
LRYKAIPVAVNVSNFGKLLLAKYFFFPTPAVADSSNYFLQTSLKTVSQDNIKHNEQLFTLRDNFLLYVKQNTKGSFEIGKKKKKFFCSLKIFRSA